MRKPVKQGIGILRCGQQEDPKEAPMVERGGAGRGGAERGREGRGGEGRHFQ